MTGTFITFEGLDGSGKTTQLRLLTDELERQRFSVVATREPGGTEFGKAVRELILNHKPAPAPLAELLLFAADRAHHVETLIRPNLAANKIVISDRFADATAAYQGAGRGFDADLIGQIINLATNGLQPDLTVYFDLTVEQSLARVARRTIEGAHENRLDREKVEFHERVRAAYLQIARDEPNRFRVVNANRTIAEVHKETVELVASFLSAK